MIKLKSLIFLPVCNFRLDLTGNWGFVRMSLLIGWSDEDGENIPKIYKTRRIHWNYMDKVILTDSSLISAFKLVVLLARGVIFEI
jgi:hypothetical protein